MKLYISILLLSFGLCAAQNKLQNNNQIINYGKIQVRTSTELNNTSVIDNKEKAEIDVESQASLNSTGQINNDGTVIAKGQVVNLNQNTIEGKVIFDSKNGEIRNIPQISYRDVEFKGDGLKLLSQDNKVLESRVRFYTSSDAYLQWNNANNGIEVQNKGFVHHDGNINPATGHGVVKLNGNTDQEITGAGQFKILELDNTSGATVIDTSESNPQGFIVSTKLNLKQGEMRNDASTNFRIGDGAEIVRNVGGSIAYEPLFEGKALLTYTGTGQIVSGPEVPTSADVLTELNVLNTDKLLLKKDATVSDKVHVESDIVLFESDTDHNIISQNTLTYNGGANPEFVNEAEISGRFVRTTLDYNGGKNLFNNEHTYGVFTQAGNPDGIQEMLFDVKRGQQWPVNPYQGDEKIRRTFEFTAKDVNGQDLASANALKVGYGWRHDADNQADLSRNETPGKLQTKILDLLLQRWNGTAAWIDNTTSTNPVETGGWLTAEAMLNTFGQHAVGLTIKDYLYILAKVLMEGPYEKDREMSTELAARNLVPNTPPDTYPYNLDPNRTLHTVTQIPADVVDWIVIEFRDKPLAPESRYFRTCMLKKDGQIVDKDGFSPVQLSRISTSNMDTTGGFWWIAIRHRNHLTFMSKDSLYIGPETNPAMYNFSDPSLAFGGTIKPIGFDINNTPVFGMIAGNFVEPSLSVQELLAGATGIDQVDITDYTKPWTSINVEEQYVNFDYNLDGIVNTKDYNKSWNNRDKITVIK